MLMKHFTLINEFKAVAICTLLMSPIQSVLAENIAKGTCGTGVTWSLDDETLTIAGSGKMNDFGNPERSESTLPSWNPYKKNIKHLVIGDEVEYIGHYAFYGYTQLEDIKFGKSVKRLGNNTFRNCTGLTELNLPESIEQIGDKWTNYSDYGGTFFGCKALKELTLPVNLKFIGANGFDQCSGIEKLFWNARDCEVDIAGYSSYDVFENCPIKEVDFGSEVNSVPERAFYTNGGLEIVKTHGTINYVGTEAFKGTTWLGNQERGMVYLDHAAYIYKDAAESDDPIKLDLPEGTRSLSSRALMGNKKLVKVTIPKTLDRIGEMAFDGCSSLGEVVWNADSASIIEDFYYGFKVQLFSSSLSKITFGEGVRVLPPSLLCKCSGLEEIKLPESLETIGEKAFSECDGITELTIPDKVKTTGREVFYQLKNVETITIGKGVKEIDYSYIFGQCPRLKTINWNATHVAENKYDYYHSDLHCMASIETLNFGDNVEYVPAMVFSKVPTLTHVKLGKGVKHIGGGAFLQDEGITEIELPDALEKIDHDAFSSTSIENLFIPENVTYLGGSSFSTSTLKQAIVTPRVTPEGATGLVYNDEAKVYTPDVEAFNEGVYDNTYKERVLPMVVANQYEFDYEEGKVPTATFSCNIPGYKLSSIENVTLDGAEGSHCTKMNATFEGARSFSTTVAYYYTVKKETETGIAQVSAEGAPTLKVDGKTILLCNLSAPTTAISIATIDGVIRKSEIVKQNTWQTTMSEAGVYVLKVGQKSYKIVVK